MLANFIMKDMVERYYKRRILCLSLKFCNIRTSHASMLPCIAMSNLD